MPLRPQRQPSRSQRQPSNSVRQTSASPYISAKGVRLLRTVREGYRVSFVYPAGPMTEELRMSWFDASGARQRTSILKLVEEHEESSPQRRFIGGIEAR